MNDNRLNGTIDARRVPVLTDTGKIVDGAEFGTLRLPLFAGEPYGYDGIARLPDGRYVYAIDDHCAGYTTLYECAIAMDAGDNIVRRREAAHLQQLQGLTARTIGNGDLTKVGENPVGWLK